MENENNVEDKFIELLKEHGYTDDSIVRVTRPENIPCDIMIKNGKRYVQAFEIKNNISPRTIHFFPVCWNSKGQSPNIYGNIQ